MSHPAFPRRLLVGLVLWLAALLPAHAHKPSDAYLHLSPSGDRLDVRWDIALRDLDVVLDLDTDRDRRLTWGEIRARHADIETLALRALTMRTAAGDCRAGPVAHALERHGDGTYAVLRFAARCPGPATRVGLAYRLFADVDPTHRGIVRLGASDGATRAVVLVPDGVPVEVGLQAAASGADGLASFVASGMHHLLIGWDHLAFLFALLLPAVLRRESGRWVPATDWRDSTGRIVAVVTAFTVAHSITLALATLQWVALPPRLVESAIAVSVVFAALNNLVPMVRRRHWQLAFAFGLVHGFGFASALADAGLQGVSLAWSLLGFNLGVEIGQLVIVALALPLCWLLRRTRLYPSTVLPALSVLLLLAGAAWFAERAFDLDLPPL